MSTISRTSSYPMIDMDRALDMIFDQTVCLQTESVHLNQCCGRIASQAVCAVDPFPTFRASMMDGYAVAIPYEIGIEYPVLERLHAGNVTEGRSLTDKSYVSYITTGAKVPDGADAVIKIEDTEHCPSLGEVEKHVKLRKQCNMGENIRAIGCDICQGEAVLRKGQRIEPAEVGLLATVGCTSVPCYSRPIVGVMSTGNELLNIDEVPCGSQIRDSNRAALIAAFQSDGYECMDLGIARDNVDELRQLLKQAMERVDVIVTSGGVSMGDKDLVKPVLAELGTIHFGRINMKPGKPSTFATLAVPGVSGVKKVLFFGLPGNPVSCLVCKALLVDPALLSMQGLEREACVLPVISAELLEDDLRLDSERPEYHRAILSFECEAGEARAVVRSTGSQRSSRLMSLSSCNALLCLPKGSGVVAAGSKVSAMLTGQVRCSPSHRVAAPLQEKENASPIKYESLSQLIPKATQLPWTIVNVALLTISDRASAGVYADESGPEMRRLLLAMSEDQSWPLTINIKHTAVVPDDAESIAAKVVQWSERGSGVDLVLTSGGTGFGPRDITPESVLSLLHRNAPGVAQALLTEGLAHTPLAVMSRPVVGTRHETLICTLPGSVKAVRENIVAMKTLLPRMMELIKSGVCTAPA